MPTLIGLESDHEEPPCFEEGPQWEPEEPESSDDDAPAPQETWMGDSWFSAELLEAWHAAERDVGLSNTVQKQKARSKDLAHWCWVPDQAFVKSAAFRGEQAGYTFSTGASGTGYYKVEAARGARPTAEILKLDLLIASSRCTPSLMAGIEPVLLCRQRQARRARGPDGKRKKQKSRKDIANAQIRAGVDIDNQPFAAHDKVQVDEPWWVSQGLFAVESANGNSWKSLNASVLTKSKADIIFGQETKIHDKDALATAERTARRAGWNPVLEAAHRTAANCGSGGGAILSRAGTGNTPIDDGLIPKGFTHRLHMSRVNAVIKGGLPCLNMYMRHSEGLSLANMTILDHAAVALNTVGGPWIAAGDFNMSPQTLAESGWLKTVGGVIMAPKVATCGENTYDYFIVHHSLAHAVVAIQRLDDAGLFPHFPVRMLIKGNARRFMVRKLIKPPLVPGALPHGPSPPPKSFASVHDLAQRDQLDLATILWLEGAREEWSSVAGLSLGFKEPQLKWRPAVPKSQPTIGHTLFAGMWRAQAQRVDRVARAFSRGDNDASQWHELQHTLTEAYSAHHRLPKKSRCEESDAIGRWAGALHTAVMQRCSKSLLALKTAALVKAKKSEAAVASARAREWRVCMGIQADKPQDTARPSRLAYRWIKGLTGWVKSALGSKEANDQVKAEGEGDDAESVDDETYDDLPSLKPTLTTDDKQHLEPLADQAEVDKEAAEWAELWQHTADYEEPQFGDLGPELEVLSPKALRAAAWSFPAGTGLGADNVSPRAIARLTDEALLALAMLFAAFERTGQWGSTLNLVLIVLLPKSDGGRRPIGLFCSLIRVWMRARVNHARAWEKEHASDSVFAGADMGAQKAAWQASYTAEAASLAGEDHAQALLDLIKAFETVPHAVLVAVARHLNYPIRLLKLSIAAYRLRRSVGIDGAYSATVQATRGITAGSGFATTELRVLLLDLVVLLKARWPIILTIKLYVDDLTLAACGLPQKVIKTLAAAVDFAVEYLEGSLRMAVSSKKSKVLASRPAIAEAVLEAASSSRTSTTTRAKLLGVDSVGGGRRSTATFRARLSAFSETVNKYQSLRRAGANTVQMVRTAGPPALMYGCECFGVSDTNLEKARGKIVKAAAPEACGKNPEIAMVALDGETGTIDPAFPAHVGPVQHWANAVYDKWFSQASLSSTFKAADDKLSKVTGNTWSNVFGPATAVVATVHRIGWTMLAYDTVQTDLGQKLDLNLDSPAAVGRAVAEGVRRWRWRKVGCILPGLIPSRPDAGVVKGTSEDRLIGCFNAASRLLKGKAPPKIAGPIADLWYKKMKGDLASAASGGQWTQVRKAGVPAFGITDNQCQLCHAAVGTPAHRFQCSSTLPSSGWPEAPAAAKKVIKLIGAKRRELLKHRGLLVLRLPPPDTTTEGTFCWVVDPTGHPQCDTAIWYFDGSMLNGKWKAMRVTGFGVAVVSTNGHLLGYGLGWPPHWVTTAAAAEAWALSTVITLVPFPPQMRTDCLALLHTAREGTDRAIHHSKPLARIWRTIADSMGVDVSELLRNDKLVWFPAHLTHKSVGQVKGSNGARLSAVDWRANRLVDKLAKIAAKALQHSKHVLELLPSADSAAAHAACLLGVVTHRANNFEEKTTDGNGKEVTKTLRDSSDKPKVKRATSEPPAAPREAAVTKVTNAPAPKKVAPWRPPSAASLAKKQEAERLARRVGEIGDSLRASDRDSGKARLAMVSERLRQRLNKQH